MDDRIKISALAGGIAFIFFQIIFNFGLFGFEFGWLKMILAFVIFAAVGGGAFAIQNAMNK